MRHFYVLSICSLYFLPGLVNGQINSLAADPEKEKKFAPYIAWHHGGKEGLEELKKNKHYEYLKELWYYSESFYVKRDYFETGVRLDESTIDISRFENLRKDDEEKIITFSDFRDVLVLLPASKLLFKPTER